MLQNTFALHWRSWNWKWTGYLCHFPCSDVFTWKVSFRMSL